MSHFDDIASRRPIPPPPGYTSRSTSRVASTTTSPTRRAAPSDECDADVAPETHASIRRDRAPRAQPTVTIRPWIDALIDEQGHDPRSRYVEQFWLGVLGPTATWLFRRVASGLEREPNGYELDLVATAAAMGLSYRPERSSPFSKAIDRCIMFGVAHAHGDGFVWRRRVPSVTERHLRRMPPSVRSAHDEWQRTVVHIDDLTRAHELAMTLLEVGDDAWTIEHHLVALGVGEATAEQVADNARRL